MEKEYIFDTASDLGRKHMEWLQNQMDPHATVFLGAIDVQPGQRCLDLGAGGGSVTRWLAERTGPTGTVVSVDLDTDYLEEQPGVQVLKHDINEGVPGEEQYDLIHARLLLMHLSRREEVFKSLVDALKPGGWLVLGDFTPRPCQVMAAPTEADKELFARIHHISHELVGRPHGMSFEWSQQVDGHMAAAGLQNIHSLEFGESSPGGGNGCLIHRSLNMQAHVPLTMAGATEAELERYRELLVDPQFRVWFYQMLYTRGQKPIA